MEKGFDIPEVSRAYFGDNPHLRVQELCGLLSGAKEQTIPYFLLDETKRYIQSLWMRKAIFYLDKFLGTSHLALFLNPIILCMIRCDIG